ncbi:MAG: right-handed parallel beta-helix repeat-containing protein, partial [Candidatus Marinimicrobia bacterium]|nr:right-handed parallel beta-helix repeat-containing protein [Candidatus Neomarinimicrobiota bacterium]
ALPPLIGQMVDENTNADTCDIYGNLYADPFFTDDSTFTLAAYSKAINAGRGNITDPDGTPSDMGAFYHHIYISAYHDELSNTVDTLGPYPVNVDVISNDGTATTSLFYSVDGENWIEKSMTASTNDTNFTTTIPGQALNTRIQYYIETESAGANKARLPLQENKYYDFLVSTFEQFAVLNGQSRSSGAIDLFWTKAAPVSGTLAGYHLYRGVNEDAVLDTEHLFRVIDKDSLHTVDIDVEEGRTYSYQLTGLIAESLDTLESVCSDVISVISDNASIMIVSGTSQLLNVDNNTGHKDIHVAFYNLPDLNLEDSTSTLSDGGYSLYLSPGYYKVAFTKEGYVPEELGGVTISKNTVLDSVFLIPGAVLDVSGDIASTTWTTSFVYYIKGNVTVPAGDTLRINPGVRVRFADSTRMTVYGCLKAMGTEENNIWFNSLNPTPIPGCWDGLYLYGQLNELRYLNYEYAAYGITGSSAHYTVIDHLNIPGNLKNTARGIDLPSSNYLSIGHSTIVAGNDYGMYLENTQRSEIFENKITGIFSVAALQMGSSQYCDVYNNSIDSETSTYSIRGIWANYSDSLKIRYNEIHADQYGIRAYNGRNYLFFGNEISDFKEYGIYFYRSENSVVDSNTIISYSGYESNIQGVSNTYSNQNSRITRNTIEIISNDHYHSGIRVHYATI